ncbi:MAG: hypothetical protein WCK91_00245 [bacterium]
MEYTSETRICQNCKKDFVIEPDDFSFYEKIGVPAPTFCHLCRAQRRFAYRNERKLFRTKDAFTGQDIFSLYPPEAGRKMLSAAEWHGDSWDAGEYAREYDFSRNFFEQLFELDTDVPALNLNVSNMVRSEYCANATELKDCYLVFASQISENCMYCTVTDQSRDCIDDSHTNQSERCYECFWVLNCYRCKFTIMSVESGDLWFCRDCLGCNDCFGCTNLRKSSYCIFNKQYTKEDYFNELKKMNLGTHVGIESARIQARDFWHKQICKNHQGVKNVNSNGSYITNSKNVNDSFLIREGEDLKYCQDLQVPSTKDSMDVSMWGDKTELCYETSGSGSNAYNVKFAWDCWPNVRDCEYSMHLRSCSDCFGCVGLKKKQYCIFNKQYTKEEYFILKEKIIRQMNDMPFVDKAGRVYKYGEFFPIQFSPYGYNNTLVADYFPITESEAENQGYPWVELKRGEYEITKKAGDLPDSINDVSDDILKEVIECEKCGKAYRIMEAELSFLKRENLPLPTLCVPCRHDRRISDRLKIELYGRICMCAGANDDKNLYKNTVSHVHGDSHCKEVIKTGYAPSQSDIVYCEKCYQQEVV